VGRAAASSRRWLCVCVYVFGEGEGWREVRERSGWSASPGRGLAHCLAEFGAWAWLAERSPARSALLLLWHLSSPRTQAFRPPPRSFPLTAPLCRVRRRTGKVLSFLGLSVGCLPEEGSAADKARELDRDVTYLTGGGGTVPQNCNKQLVEGVPMVAGNCTDAHRLFPSCPASDGCRGAVFCLALSCPGSSWCQRSCGSSAAVPCHACLVSGFYYALTQVSKQAVVCLLPWCSPAAGIHVPL
jgi:hypothetical protein